MAHSKKFIFTRKYNFDAIVFGFKVSGTMGTFDG